jgi:hypothetical protein
MVNQAIDFVAFALAEKLMSIIFYLSQRKLYYSRSNFGRGFTRKREDRQNKVDGAVTRPVVGPF